MRPVFINNRMRLFEQRAQLVPFRGVGGRDGGEAVDEGEEGEEDAAG